MNGFRTKDITKIVMFIFSKFARYLHVTPISITHLFAFAKVIQM